MLYYKAWLESRVRFLAAGAVLSLYCLTFIQRARIDFPPVLEPMLPYTAHVWRGIYHGLVAIVFVVMAGVLGGGGPEREREAGSCAVTLAPPVEKILIFWPRVGVARFEMSTPARIPPILVSLASARI